MEFYCHFFFKHHHIVMISMKTPSLTEIINYNLHAQPKHFIYQQWLKQYVFQIMPHYQ